MSDLLDAWFDVIERAAMTKALEKGDEKLAGEAAEAREKLIEYVASLETGRQYSKSPFELDKLLEVINGAIAVADGEGCDELAREAREARERIRQEFEKLRERLALSEHSDAEARGFNQQYSERIASLEAELLRAQQRIQELTQK